MDQQPLIGNKMASTQIQSQQLRYSVDNLRQQIKQSGDITALRKSILDDSDVGVKSTYMQAFANLFKSYIGIGILSLPGAFYSSGWVLASIVLVLMGAAVCYTIAILHEVAHHRFGEKPNITYSDVFQTFLGIQAEYIYKFFLVFLLVGVCVSYIIFCVQLGLQLCNYSNDIQHRAIFTAISLVVILPMNVISNFTYLVKYSIFAIAAQAIAFLCIFEYSLDTLGFNDYPDRTNQSFKPENLFKFDQIGSFLGIATFSFECIGITFPIRNSMKNPSRFVHMFCVCTFFVITLNVTFSIVNCFAFGSDLGDIVLLKLQDKRTWFIGLSVAYGLALLLTYPLQIIPAFVLLEETETISNINKNYEGLQKYWLRFLMTLVIAALVVLVPSFSDFLNIVGAVAGTALQFVFPVITHFACFGLKMDKYKIVLNVVIISIGLVGGVFSTYYSVKSMIDDS